MSWSLETLGIMHSCYQEKFAVPRQPGLAPSAYATLELLPPYNLPECVVGLDDFSHLWVSFIFHQNIDQGWNPKVRPPRLGGNKKVGVFASRSTFRPNGLGLSVVKLESIDLSQGVKLHLSGTDLIDGTPIVDIKPYIPWVDGQPEAFAAWAHEPPELLTVRLQDKAVQQLADHPKGSQLKQLIMEVLAQNPRPAYQKIDPKRVYGVKLADLDVRFSYQLDASLEVIAVY